MWSKIRRWFSSRTFPISTKLTILYTSILFFILLFTSFLALIGLHIVLNAQSEKELDISIRNVMRYLEAGNPVDSKLLEQNLLMPEVALRVFDNQGNLLLDSSPYLFEHNRPVKDRENQNIRKHPHPPERHAEDFRTETHTDDIYYTQVPVRSGERLYYLQFIRTISSQTAFLRTLTISLLVANLLGLLIALLSGMFISRKILRPIKSITETANEIEITDLSRRIPVSGNKDELAELANTFNHMLERIHRGFEQQRRFVADASHELRTPITVISGYADMLDRWGKEKRSVLDEGIAAIKLETTNMQKLIEKLLFLARADQGTQVINKVPLNTQSLIEEIFQETCLIAPNHQVLLEQNDASSILADASSLKQMLRAFIENSIKYTPRGGTIRICSQQLGQHLAITIQDSGIGIPLEEQSKIFSRFYRIDKSRSKETGGTGLGLSIAHWIAKQHDITIRIKSTPGAGTAIIAEIPLLSHIKKPG